MEDQAAIETAQSVLNQANAALQNNPYDDDVQEATQTLAASEN